MPNKNQFERPNHREVEGGTQLEWKWDERGEKQWCPKVGDVCYPLIWGLPTELSRKWHGVAVTVVSAEFTKGQWTFRAKPKGGA